MLILLTILLLSIAARYFKLPPFETVSGIFLLLPVVAFLIGFFFPSNQAIYLVILVILLLLARALSVTGGFASKAQSEKGVDVITLFLFSFIIFYGLCLVWPDFIAIAERPRDYAVLASVIKDHISPQEPWMAGAELGYYLYWYRFGHVLATTFSLDVWQVYHQMQAFTFSFFLCALYQTVKLIGRFSNLISLFIAVFITMGSNIAGVITFLGRQARHLKDATGGRAQELFLALERAGLEASGGAGWWGPSRVIEGAINEFPAWSFLLGDAHPHYLNLGLIPFFILLAYRVHPLNLSGPLKLFWAIVFLIIPFLWLYNSNPWEVPVWLGTWTIFCGIMFLYWRFDKEERVKISGNFRFLLLISAMAILISLSLYLSSLTIFNPGSPLRLVKDPISRSTLAEIALHWGYPLFLIGISNLILLKSWSWRIYSLTFIALSFFYIEALPLIVTLFLINGMRLAIEISSGKVNVFTETIGIAALGLIIVPEILFLDDVYGGINERMNTIFKFYSSNWVLLHLFAFLLFRDAVFHVQLPIKWWTTYPLQLAILLLFTGFFFQSIDLRATRSAVDLPRERGLSTVEEFFPGSADIITFLEAYSDLVILESQGPPYSYTAHVATLSGQRAFLGWANHMRVYWQTHEEVDRREALTQEFYTSYSCQRRAEIMESEGIDMAIFGPLEMRKHPELKEDDFNCLQLVKRNKGYLVFQKSG